MSHRRETAVDWLIALTLAFALSCHPVVAAPVFEPRDQSAASLQSRTFEGVSEHQLALACLAALQDLRFLVLETQVQPMTLIAAAPSPTYLQRKPTLSITVSADPSERSRLIVRIQRVASNDSNTAQAASADVDFYQNFFNHLSATLHRQGALTSI